MDPELPTLERIDGLGKHFKESLHTLQNEIEELASHEQINEEKYRLLCNQLKDVNDKCTMSMNLNNALISLVKATKQKIRLSSGMNDSLKEGIDAQKQIVTLCEYGNRKMLSLIRKHRPLNARRLRSNNQRTFTFDQDEIDTMVSYLSYWESRDARIAAHIAANAASSQPR
jgi:hypothetical protein